MVAKPAASPESPPIEARIAAHREEMARYRADEGDPEEALRGWVRTVFDRDALIQTYDEYMGEEGLGLGRDEGSRADG